jgi:hypothetical protein
MKKTALQQAIREIAELWSSPSDQPSYVQVFDVLKSKLPVEKQQIIDAYVECWKTHVPNGIECKLPTKE